MRRISLKKCKPGMKLAKTIYSEGGRVLLSEGVELKESYIRRLELCNVSEIYIEDEFSKDIEVSDVIDERTRIEARALIKSIMENRKGNLGANLYKAKVMVDRIMEELLSKRDIIINLSDIKTVDDYTFSHCVNVCVLSLVTGVKLGLNQLRLRELGVGALLHDVGKVAVPPEILKKNGRLTDEEFEQIKQHTVAGHGILKADLDISYTSAYVALGHHERYDGSGYPLGFKGENIHQFARVVAIADVFDALTSDRVYREKSKTHEVVEYMTASAGTLFDKVILECFIKNIALYSIGTCVLLDTGEKGIVTGLNKSMPTRPVVRIVYNADGSLCSGLSEIDLAKVLNVIIIDTCDL